MQPVIGSSPKTSYALNIWFWLFWGAGIGYLQWRHQTPSIVGYSFIPDSINWMALGLCVYEMQCLLEYDSKKIGFWRSLPLILIIFGLMSISGSFVLRICRPHSIGAYKIEEGVGYALIAILAHLFRKLADRSDKVRNVLNRLRLSQESLCQ
jgi:hypothetical protein